jgi:hypothetical protein
MKHKLPLNTDALFHAYYQVENRMHKEYHVLDKSTNDWIAEYQCLSEAVKEKTQIANYGILTAQIFPDTDVNILIPIARWMLWAFIYDDFYGPSAKDELEMICNKAIRILQGEKPAPEENALFQQLYTTRNELLAVATPAWLERFVSSHRYYFSGLLLDEYSYKQNIQYPTSQEYLYIRDRLIGGFMVCDLLELADGVLPEEIFLHPYIQRLRLLATRMMIWDNDIFSYKKELAENEAMNIVLIMSAEKGISIEEAVAEAFEIRRKDYEELINYEQVMPDFGIFNTLVKNYLRNVLILLQGQLEWYKKKSLRYR